MNLSFGANISTRMRLNDFSSLHAVRAHPLGLLSLTDRNDEECSGRAKPVDSEEEIQSGGGVTPFRMPAWPWGLCIANRLCSRFNLLLGSTREGPGYGRESLFKDAFAGICPHGAWCGAGSADRRQG